MRQLFVVIVVVETSIKNMRSFYLTFSKLQISQTMLDQSRIGKRTPPIAKDCP